MSIGLSKKFSFERTIISNALREFRENLTLSKKEVMSKLGIGGEKAEAVVLWLGKLGLRNNKGKKLTPLGELLLEHDTYLEDPITQWLLHYQFASNKNAEVWYLLTNEFLPNHSTFSYDDCLSFLVSKGIRSKEDKHLRADISIYLRAFVSTNGLEKTGFIKVEGELKRNIAKNVFYKNPPQDISPYLVAYIIFDQRMRNYPNFMTITIKELLTEPGNVGRVLSLNREKLEKILILLSGREYGSLISLSTTAGLDQVGLIFKGLPLDILKRYYNTQR